MSVSLQPGRDTAGDDDNDAPQESTSTIASASDNANTLPTHPESDDKIKRVVGDEVATGGPNSLSQRLQQAADNLGKLAHGTVALTSVREHVL